MEDDLTECRKCNFARENHYPVTGANGEQILVCPSSTYMPHSLEEEVLCACGCGTPVPRSAVEWRTRHGQLNDPLYLNPTHRIKMRQRRYRARKKENAPT